MLMRHTLTMMVVNVGAVKRSFTVANKHTFHPVSKVKVKDWHRAPLTIVAAQWGRDTDRLGTTSRPRRQRARCRHKVLSVTDRSVVLTVLVVVAADVRSKAARWILSTARWTLESLQPDTRHSCTVRHNLSQVILLYHYLKYAIVSGPTRVSWYVEIIAVSQCINIPGQHSCSRSTIPVNSTGQHYQSILLGNMTLY